MSSPPGSRSLAQSSRARLALLLAIGIAPFELNGLYNPVLSDTPWIFWAADALSWIVVPLIVFVAGWRSGLFTPSSIGLGLKFEDKQSIDSFIIGCIGLPFLLYFVHRQTYWLSQEYLGSACSWRYFFYSKPLNLLTWRLPGLVYMSVTAGVVEEIFYRGMFRRLFGNRAIDLGLYVVISSIVFSSVHWEQGLCNSMACLAFGIVAASAYLIIGNLWPLIFAHIAIDLVML